MLVGVGGLESFFGFGADDDGGEVSTPTGIEAPSFLATNVSK